MERLQRVIQIMLLMIGVSSFLYAIAIVAQIQLDRMAQLGKDDQGQAASGIALAVVGTASLKILFGIWDEEDSEKEK